MNLYSSPFLNKMGFNVVTMAPPVLQQCENILYPLPFELRQFDTDQIDRK